MTVSFVAQKTVQLDSTLIVPAAFGLARVGCEPLRAALSLLHPVPLRGARTGSKVVPASGVCDAAHSAVEGLLEMWGAAASGAGPAASSVHLRTMRIAATQWTRPIRGSRASSGRRHRSSQQNQRGPSSPCRASYLHFCTFLWNELLGPA